MTRRLMITLAGMAAVLVGLPATAGAASNPKSPPAGFNFGIRPYANPGAPSRSALTFEVAPGQSVADRVELVNSGDEPKAFYVYPTDAYTTEIGGGFGLHLRTDPRRDAAAWTTLPVDQYTVPPHSAALVPVQLAVPADATPGDHTAAVVAEEIFPPTSLDHGAGVVAVHRVGARLYARVEGPIHPALQLDRLTVTHRQPLVPYVTGQGSTTITFTVANTGNSRVRLDDIDFSLTGFFGREVRRASLTRVPGDGSQSTSLPDQIIPGSKITLTRTLHGLPPFEELTATVTVKGQDSLLNQAISTSRAATFWVIPWWLLAVLAAALGFRGWRRRRRGGAARRRPVPLDDPSTAALEQVYVG